MEKWKKGSERGPDVVKSLAAYKALITSIDQRCKDILARYGDEICCSRGCAGNCCRIHLSAYPVESFHLSRALQKQPDDFVSRIRARAAKRAATGPCPLLYRGGCSLYPDRLLLCRTHGLPMITRYRGTVAVGCCQKNFRHLPSIPTDACIDLDGLNARLAAVNRRFLSEYRGRSPLKERYLIGEALQIEF